MDLNLIKKLVKVVDSSGITDLVIEEEGTKIKIGKRLTNGKMVTQPQYIQQAPVQPQQVEQPAQQSSEEKFATAKEEKQENLHEIKSPIVGTFYRAPAPDADPYVQIGDNVSAGSVLCIVEAMKLMNEIESDVSGKIVKILVDNGKPVEYNQPLFLVKQG